MPTPARMPYLELIGRYPPQPRRRHKSGHLSGPTPRGPGARRTENGFQRVMPGVE